MGIGAICHTINPRLFPEQIAYIVNHAEDRMIFVDLTFVPILEKLAKQIDVVETFVVLTDRAHMPQTSLRNVVAFEDLVAEADDDFAWSKLDENTAAGLCYVRHDRQPEGCSLLTPFECPACDGRQHV
jgi:fatty-acyl-CoA synthase